MRVTLNLSSRAAELLLRLQPGGRSRTVSTLLEEKLGQPDGAAVVVKAGRRVGVGVRPATVEEVRRLKEEWP